MPGGRTLRVTVPWGTQQVQVGPVRDAAPRTPGAGETVRAPRGGRLVYVSAETDTASLLPLARRPGPGPPDAALAVVAGGRAYPLRGLQAPRTASGLLIGTRRAQWVAVAGDASDLRLRVTYDGQSEALDPRRPRPAGGFAALGAVAHQARLSRPDIRCGRERWTAPYGRAPGVPAPTCVLGRVDRAPYVGGLGWARPGREWLIVTADADGPYRFARRGVEYRNDEQLRDAPPVYALDGQRPSARLCRSTTWPTAGSRCPASPIRRSSTSTRAATGQTLSIAVAVAGTRLASGAAKAPVSSGRQLARWSVKLPG